MNNPEGTSRVRRRDQLRSFVQSKAIVIKQEINRYYETPPTSSPRLFQSRSTTSMNTSNPSLPRSNEIQRTETQEIDDILKDPTAGPEIVQPQCMLFPTYACQVNQPEQEVVKYRVVLAGWAFAKPGSSRLDRWLLGKKKKKKYI
jgi:hypothetical protein